MHNEIYPIKAMIYPTYQIVNILRFDSETGYAEFYYYDDVPGIAEKMYRFGKTMIKDIMWMRVENDGHPVLPERKTEPHASWGKIPEKV